MQKRSLRTWHINAERAEGSRAKEALGLDLNGVAEALGIKI
jgi:hypothetical protein